ncbi:putative protease [Methylobacillus rhizosphaerae]|uniref:Putative protease n=1 Tax=Methylobacillus rhizosphaerae TaxID=551994 RepID=A0A239A1A2_9PROT|nr:U32 family peptidase [Methylobacillus rhizosphaerae]SNR89466.1 putative protease [Methylobacillus rhizosphaerae]
MTQSRRHLELLAPARNADYGIAAINHGADAVYIGGPAFGARAKAENSVQDIARLVAHAHRYHAEVFVAFNTIFHDNELEAARQTAWQLYDAGVDALIVQDMGLLQMDIPPIQLHASTQTDIRTVEKAVFLDQVGFTQIVLAREMDLNTIRKVADATQCNLEFFIHGALCVAFSGQCYISHAHTGRSANRGECSQECRLPYTLEDSQGRILAKDKHLLSMKDNDQSANLRALADAGVSAFKIEGRYKDIAYVKNATAYYRQLLDEIIEDNPHYRRASSGRAIFSFVPQPEKTFNRSTTEYFLHGRGEDVGAFDTPKFAGEEIGRVTKVGPDYFEVETSLELHNGDGVCFFDVHKELTGMRINTVQGKRLYPNEMPADMRRNMKVYRNRDHAFLRLLEKDSAQRKIDVAMTLHETADGFALSMQDEDGFMAYVQTSAEKQPAEQVEKAQANIRDNLAKLGNTEFSAGEVALDLKASWFIPNSVVNQLRREAVAQLQATRLLGYERPVPGTPAEPPAQYPQDTLSYLSNVYNKKAHEFYEKHGVQAIAAAYEANEELGEVPVMITKHCLRYSFAMCPKEAKGVIGVQGTITAEPMTLISGKDRISLKFDCKRCEMHVMGKVRKNVLQLPQPQPVQFFAKRPV